MTAIIQYTEHTDVSASTQHMYITTIAIATITTVHVCHCSVLGSLIYSYFKFFEQKKQRKMNDGDTTSDVGSDKVEEDTEEDGVDKQDKDDTS